ncbi:MAG: hypothetical protein QOJ00_2393 [Actinomycetota bacterium]|jgi:hypothetical protein
MSTGANLGYTEPIDGTVPDGFDVANLGDGVATVAEHADRSHVASRKLLVIVDDANADTAISAAQRAGVEADVWAVAHVDDASHARRIAAAARAGGRDNVGCVRYGPQPSPTDDGDGWIGVLDADR